METDVFSGGHNHFHRAYCLPCLHLDIILQERQSILMLMMELNTLFILSFSFRVV